LELTELAQSLAGSGRLVVMLELNPRRIKSPSWRRYSSRRFGSFRTSYRRAVRSREEIWLNSSWLARAAVTPSTTIFCPVSASARICSAAVNTATRSGTAISARPRSINPLNDLGRAQCIAAFYPEELSSVSPRLASEPLLPLQRGLYDGVQVIEAGLPAQFGSNAVRACDENGRIAGATGFSRIVRECPRRARRSSALLARYNVAIPYVQYLRRAAFSQVREGIEMAVARSST